MEFGEHLREHIHHALHVGVAEHHEGEQHKHKSAQHRKEAFHALAAIVAVVVQDIHPESAVHHLRQAKERAPNHEIPTRTMPQASQEHGDENIEAGAQVAFTVATERDIHIVANPRRERNMPASPKVAHTVGLIWCVEVGWESEAQQQRDAYRHIAVAAKVAIELHGVAEQSEQILHAGISKRIVEHTVHEVDADIVANHRLLKQANHNQIHAHRNHAVVDHKRLTDLRCKVAGTHNRASHQLREERHIERIVEQRIERTQFATIHIDGVTQALECEETDAHWQENVPRLEILPHDKGEVGTEEIGILEITQEAQIYRQTQQHEHLAITTAITQIVGILLSAVVYRLGYQIVAHRDHCKQNEVNAAALVVEIVGKQRDEKNARREGAVKHVIHQREAHKQHQEQAATEYDRALWVVGEQMH